MDACRHPRLLASPLLAGASWADLARQREASRALGVEVFGLSLVTNLAAGITGEPLNHEEVLEAGRAAASRMGGLLRELVARS